MAQTGACAVLSLEEYRGKVLYLAALDKTKFRRRVVPGDVLRLEVEFVKLKKNAGIGCGAAYVDGSLAKALAGLREEQMEKGPSPEIPQQLFAYSRKYNSRKKHVVFVARIDALKMWEFDSGKISAGGYFPSEKDIIKGVSANPSAELRYGAAELPKDYRGYIGFFVPAENVKPGTKIKLGYGDDIAEWLVP
jgi:hypothetical protein